MKTYERHSPSSLNLFAADREMFIAEKIFGMKQPGSATMVRGIAVEDGVALGLKDPNAPVADCIAAAIKTYDTKTALMSDPRRDKLREEIPGMVETAIEELRPYGIPSAAQGFIEKRFPDLNLPIVGYFDFEWSEHGIIVDLKTTDKMPSQVKPGHARQVAFYCSDNVEGRISYITPKKRATYQLENKRAHLDALIRIAKSCERFLALSDDPQFFVNITAPNYESFYWNNPAARQMGYEIWGY